MLPLLTALLALQHPPDFDFVRCTPATAVSTTVQQLGDHPKLYEGRCVTVRGPALFNAIYSSVEGIYLSTKPDALGAVPLTNRSNRVGLYFDEIGEQGRPTPLWQKLAPGVRLLQATGLADSCERRIRRARARLDEENRLNPPQNNEIRFVMPSGYCHYHGGAIVRMTQGVVPNEVRYERLTGDGMRASFGDLVPAPAEWRHSAWLQSFAHRFAEAVSTRDRKRLAALTRPFGLSRDEMRFLLDSPDSTFRELRQSPPRPFVILVEATWRGRGPAERRKEREATICFCRRIDCEQSWPISVIDTYSHPQHPYACLSVGEASNGDVFTLMIHDTEERAALEEPEGSRMQ